MRWKLDALTRGLNCAGSRSKRCILADPNLLLLDEPFGSLDYGTKLDVSNVLVKYVKENNKKAILVSHSVDDLMMLADRALISRETPLDLEYKCERGISTSSEVDVLTRLQDEEFRHGLISLTMDQRRVGFETPSSSS